MANYKETNVSGTSWVRCRQIEITNPVQATAPKTVFFYEEKIINIDGALTSLPQSSCRKVFDPVAGTITIVDPTTGNPTGSTVSHLELYNILYSLYIQTALERDAEEAAAAAVAAATLAAAP